MNSLYFWIYLLLMAGSTYLIRTIPFVAFKKNIKNPYVKTFLTYIPYTVLTAMTFPAILYATSSIYSALGGFLVAIFFAYRKKSLTTVAILACLTVFVLEFLF